MPVHTPEPKIPFTPIPGVVKLQMKGHYQGQPWTNIFHLLSPIIVGFDNTQMAALATAMGTHYGALLQPGKNPGDIFEECVATDLSSGTGGIGVAGFSVSGSTAGAVMPANLAHCVSWAIGRRYRGGKPRTYIGGVTGGDIADSRSFTLASTTSLENNANGFRIAVNADVTPPGAPYNLVCVHYLKNHALLTPPLVDLITDCTVDLRVCAQSRRLGRVLTPTT